MPALHLLTASGNPKKLANQLRAFLLFCKVEGLSPATLHNYEYKISSFIKFCEQQQITEVDQVTPTVIRLFLLSLKEHISRATKQLMSPVSICDYFKDIKRFFNWLIEEGVLEKSPMTQMKPPKIPNKIVKPFTMEQISQLLAECDGRVFLKARNKAIILMLLDTGLRRQELANIQLNDIDFDREIIKVMGKGAKERVVRVGKRTQKSLLVYLLMRNDSYPCLWVNEERRPLTTDGIFQAIQELGKQAGLVGVRCSPHTRVPVYTSLVSIL